VIASLAFEPALGRVRRARFVPRATLTLDAACAVANGIGDAFAQVFDGACRVTLGEPVALDAVAWRSLATHALAFVMPGRETDLVFVVPRRDARALIAAAFHDEDAAHATAPWTVLEAGAMERIFSRAAPACDAICGERRGAVHAIDPARLDPCVDFFDLRVTAPVRLTIGIGLLRPLAAPRPARTLDPGMLGSVALDARVVLGRGSIVAARLLGLRVGDVLSLCTKVDGNAELNVGALRIALGTCGVVNGHVAFDVQSPLLRGDAQ
jgi:hypothetical protein